MNYINFPHILFYLLLHVPIIYPAEKGNSTEDGKNPFTKVQTYQDSSGNFTLAKAEEIAKDRTDTALCNWFHWPEDHVALKWTCNQKSFDKNDRLKIAEFLVQNDTSTFSKEEALHACLRDEKNNSEIIKFLQRHVLEQGSSGN